MTKMIESTLVRLDELGVLKRSEISLNKDKKKNIGSQVKRNEDSLNKSKANVENLKKQNHSSDDHHLQCSKIRN